MARSRCSREGRHPDSFCLVGAGQHGMARLLRHAATGEVMGVVGIAALLANGSVAFMLYRFRTGDANMRSVWICSRNDAIGNAAVMLAAMGVFGTGTGWPDLIVAAIMGGLGLRGGWQIVHQARGELLSERRALVGVAAE